MLYSLARNWWWFALRGGLAILFGIAAFVWPELTITVLVMLFGAYALADGVVSVLSAVAGEEDVREPRPAWELMLGGIAGIGAGLLTLFLPDITAIVLLYLIASWAIATGAVEFLAALRLRREVENELLLALSGVLSILFGIVVVAIPSAGALAVAWLIGAYALAFGVVLLGLAFRLREFASRGTPSATA
jgi:uncharacterized membrane protein HdeD (DUF308 family)